MFFRFHYTLVVVQVFFIQLHTSLSVLLLSAREVSVDKNNTTWCSLRQAWHRYTERIHPRTPKTPTLLAPCPAYQTCWPIGTHPRPLQTHRISSHTEIKYCVNSHSRTELTHIIILRIVQYYIKAKLKRVCDWTL